MQWAPPVPNRKRQIAVGTTGPEPNRVPERTPEEIPNRLPEVVLKLQA